MRRALFSLVGLLLAGGAVVTFCYSIYSLGHIGTCASGGPYVSARPCPPGTGLKIMLIFAAVIGGLAGVLLYSGGVRWKRPSPIPLGMLMWSATFLGVAGALAYSAWGPAAYDVDGGGVQLAAIVLLVIFVPMGIIPLLVVGFGNRSRRRGVRVPAAGTTPGTTPPPVAPRPTPVGRAPVGDPVPNPSRLLSGLALSGPARTGDVVARLERLAGLKASGAITQEEFDRLKATLLRED